MNYQIDGGDNNDDTVGGLLQLFPLEAIQEFNFVTQRFKAEYGRSNGGVMNIVTKSGTNDMRGSAFTMFRDKSLNSQTFSEEIANIDKQDYRRYQFGGSFGGPIARDRRTSSPRVERTQQDTNQAVDTRGLVPERGRRVRHAGAREPLHRQGDEQPAPRLTTSPSATAATRTPSRTAPRCATRPPRGARARTRSIRST